MKHINLHFRLHQPFRLRPFSFMDIGEMKDYFDEDLNRRILRDTALGSYLPVNRILLDLIRDYKGRFRVSFSLSGLALEQFEQYMPEVTDSFRALADTGCVEFLGLPYSQSLAALGSEREFVRQLSAHGEYIEALFGRRPQAFDNTSMTCSDAHMQTLYNLGFKTVLSAALTGLNSNRLYRVQVQPGLKTLMRNTGLSDDIALRFSDRKWREWPLTAGKFRQWLQGSPEDERIINLSVDYENFGGRHAASSGIFDFLKAFGDDILSSQGWRFLTVSEAADTLPADGVASMPQSHTVELAACLGNELQQDAFETLYALERKVKACGDRLIHRDWSYLQAADHFFYMADTLPELAPGNSYSTYDNPFHAFMNYMNILTDFSLRVDQDLDNRKKFTDERYSIKAGSPL